MEDEDALHKSDKWDSFTKTSQKTWRENKWRKRGCGDDVKLIKVNGDKQPRWREEETIMQK